MPIGSSHRHAALVAQRAAAAAATAAAAAPVAPTSATGSTTHASHHHAEGHHATQHGPHGGHAPAAHGPTRPRRPPKAAKSSKKKKAKRGAGAHADDDDLDIPEADEQDAAGSLAPVSFGGEQRDGSDDDDEGGEDRRRENNLATARGYAESAGGAGTVKRMSALHRVSLETARARYLESLCTLAATEDPAFARKRLDALLQLLERTAETAVVARNRRGQPTRWRLDTGGWPRVREQLAPAMAAAFARHGRKPPSERGQRLFAMLPADVFRLQRSLTRGMRDALIARLKIATAATNILRPGTGR